MDDITRCKGELTSGICPLRDRCLRFKLTLIPDEFTSWFMDAPYNSATQDCDHMIETKARSCSRQTL